MDGHEGRHLRCNPKPSRTALEQELHELRDQLKYYLKTNPRQLMTTDVNAAYQVPKKLKDIFAKFTERSRALTSLILSGGGSDEAVPLRQERIELREEVEETINHMNIILREFGEVKNNKPLSPNSSAQDIPDDSTSSDIVGHEPLGLATTFDWHHIHSPIPKVAEIFMPKREPPFKPASKPSCTVGPSIIQSSGITPARQMHDGATIGAPQSAMSVFPFGNYCPTPDYTSLCYSEPSISAQLSAMSVSRNSVSDMVHYPSSAWMSFYGERHQHFTFPYYSNQYSSVTIL